MHAQSFTIHACLHVLYMHVCMCKSSVQRVEDEHAAFNNYRKSCRFPCIEKVFSSFPLSIPLQGYKKRRYFIATQAPLDNTIVDFWKMATCCKPESRTIVLLCDLVENGKVCEDQK